MARARDEGDRDQLAIERARAESQAARSDDLAQRVLGHPLREADAAALETVQIADLQAAATRCEAPTRRRERTRSRTSRRAPSWPPRVLCCALAALAIAFSGPASAGALAALLAAVAALALARDAARRPHDARGARGALGRPERARRVARRPARGRVAHRAPRSHARQRRRAAARRSRASRPSRRSDWRSSRRPSCARPSAARRSPLCSAPTIPSASRRSSRRPSDATPRRTVAASALAELEPRATAAAERAQRVGDAPRAAREPRAQRLAVGRRGRRLERLHAAATRRVAADQRERSLVEGVPELDALLATAREREARGERLVLSDDEHATLVAELREARARAEELMLREQELSARARPARLRRARSGDVEGELRAVEDELAAVKRERDRLALAAAIVRRAEREVRERYAPAWLQSASRYLEAITHGRYSGVAIVETPGGEPVLEVTRAGEAMPVRVGPPLSRGTLEQIYVAVRLALVDAIDAEARLPLFLDELFAHWDAHRLDALRARARSGRGAPGRGLHLPCRAGRPARALVRRARHRAAGPDGATRAAAAAPAGRGHRGARAGGPDPARPARGLRPAPTARARSGGASADDPTAGDPAASNAPPLLKTVLRFGRGSDRRAYDDRHHRPDQALRRRRRARRGQRGAGRRRDRPAGRERRRQVDADAGTARPRRARRRHAPRCSASTRQRAASSCAAASATCPSTSACPAG